MTSVHIKRGNSDTGRMLPELEGRDWGDVSTNQEAPKIASKLLEGQEEDWNRFFLIALSRSQPGWHLDL